MASNLKGEGLGRLLLEKMIRYASGRGTHRLTAYVLRENSSMRELARSLGFSTDPPLPDETDTVHMSLVLAPSAAAAAAHGRADVESEPEAE